MATSRRRRHTPRRVRAAGDELAYSSPPSPEVIEGETMAHGLPPCRAVCQVADLMTPRPITVTLDTPVRDVFRTMNERRFRHMPVVDKEGRLLGLVSQYYLMRVMDPSQSSPELDRPIADIMARTIDTVLAERCAAEA